MADSDPISESSTPNKRRKLDGGNSKAWDSQDDSGEDFTVEDFHTVATMPMSGAQQSQLQYTKEQFHSDLRTNEQSRRTYITQPTQSMRISSPPHTSDILVERSSPAASSPKPLPQPIRRALSKPTILASAMAPPGTAFRAPAGIQQRKPTPVQIDSDSDEDPPIHHSSDEGETQGIRSNLKPTAFVKGGRTLDSAQSRNLIKESPRAPAPHAPVDTLKNFLADFAYRSPSKSTDDMASAYSNASRRPKLPQAAAPATAVPKINTNAFNSVDDIDNYVLRKKVLEIQAVFSQESVQRCVDALTRNRSNVDDAKAWLAMDEERDAPGEDDDDELASNSPVAKRGVAMKSGTQSSQPVRTAKQEVTAPTKRIAERWGSIGGRPSQRESPEDDAAKPRRRLQQGRKSARASPQPDSSPPQKLPQPVQRLKNKAIVISDEEDEDKDTDTESGMQQAVHEEAHSTVSLHNERLLKFFNECSLQELADLSAQKEENAKVVLDNRPFTSLEDIRAISDTRHTKSGKKSTRALGEKLLEICDDMLAGYDAVDDLVRRCESIAAPIQATLRQWSSSAAVNDGELHLMDIDHDSGIGTPTSSSASEVLSTSPKRHLLGQPSSISEQFVLKDYQLVGLNWLNLLWSKKLSCILADEMGLGKTCQVITFLAHLQEIEVDGVHLVVVPGSTLVNWLREFKEIAPKLKVVAYYGSQAERRDLQYRIEEEFSSIDVVVTTIDMAVSPEDNKFLRKHIDPLVYVLDEAHSLRNRNSKRYSQLSKIRGSCRVLLTGTPLQNNLQELMAILAFMMPNLFEEKQEDLRFIFQHKATTKDVHNTALLSSQRIARARSMMTPFILRRRKAQVLDLPPKKNYIEFCDMTTSQENYYGSLLQEFQEYLSQPAKSKKASSPASSNMLMALRKAAIHPLLARRLYDDKKIDKIVAELMKNPDWSPNGPEKTRDYLVGDHWQSFKGGDYGLHRFCQERESLRKYALKKREWTSSSGKVEKFEELIRKFAANGDRTLVFSQFTTMMDILEAVLENLNIRFMRLDGSTDMQIRQDMLDKFTEDTSIPVFMLSTKAGGAGINLACANKVIIFDSGFNPQDDIQAENRAHRLGQKNPVDVYRLVTRGTIEEQIQELNDVKITLGEQVADESSGGEKQTENANAQLVEQLLLNSLKSKEDANQDAKEDAQEDAKEHSDAHRIGNAIDIRDAFKCGLEDAGLRVSSKQAQF